MSWFEVVADRKIREAQEEGVFDNLPGRGKPLDLSGDRDVPPEMRMAYRLLRQADYVPDWIEIDRDIRRREEKWDERAAWARSRVLTARQREAFLVEAVSALLELNRHIDRFNLIVPILSRQRLRIDALHRMERLDATIPGPVAASPKWRTLLDRQQRIGKVSTPLPRLRGHAGLG